MANTYANAPQMKFKFGRVALYLILIFVGILALLPFVWMVLSSFKSFGDFINIEFSSVPSALKSFWTWPPFGTSPPEFANYPTAIRRIDPRLSPLHILQPTRLPRTSHALF